MNRLVACITFAAFTILLMGCGGVKNDFRGQWVMDPDLTQENGRVPFLSDEEIQDFKENPYRIFYDFKKGNLLVSDCSSNIDYSAKILSVDSTSITAQCHGQGCIISDKPKPLIRYVLVDEDTHYVELIKQDTNGPPILGNEYYRRVR